jgi:hypothetical protein
VGGSGTRVVLRGMKRSGQDAGLGGRSRGGGDEDADLAAALRASMADAYRGSGGEGAGAGGGDETAGGRDDDEELAAAIAASLADHHAGPHERREQQGEGGAPGEEWAVGEGGRGPGAGGEGKSAAPGAAKGRVDATLALPTLGEEAPNFGVAAVGGLTGAAVGGLNSAAFAHP